MLHRREVLEEILAGRIGGTLKVVRSTKAAFGTLVDSLPDVILMSPLLAPQDEEQIVTHLGALGVDASHVQLLTIPRFGDGAGAIKKRRFGWQSQKPLSIASGGCDPDAFAHEVSEYLAQASTLRRNQAVIEPTPAAPDAFADLRIGTSSNCWNGSMCLCSLFPRTRSKKPWNLFRKRRFTSEMML